MKTAKPFQKYLWCVGISFPRTLPCPRRKWKAICLGWTNDIVRLPLGMYINYRRVWLLPERGIHVKWPDSQAEIYGSLKERSNWSYFVIDARGSAKRLVRRPNKRSCRPQWRSVNQYQVCDHRKARFACLGKCRWKLSEARKVPRPESTYAPFSSLTATYALAFMTRAHSNKTGHICERWSCDLYPWKPDVIFLRK
jgi:hypothetical protein